MSRVYISYRSIDSHQKAIQQIYADLTQKYGTDSVTLSPQDQSLDNTIRQTQVRSHDALLVIFGRYGLNMVDERGNRLIDDPYDGQHIEISAGLKYRMQIQTLVFDDMVEDLSEHIPEVLSGLTKHPIILNVNNATVSDALVNLVEAIGDAKPRIPVTKPDISKMVIQPTSKQSDTHVMHLQQPVSAQPSTPEPEIYIHESRNPVIRLLQRIGGQLAGQNTHPTQSEENTRPNTSRPRVESYRQMWPTSFLIIAVVIALAMFVAVMFNTGTSNVNDAQFSLRQVTTMGRGAVDIAFSSDRSQVAHISYRDVYHFDWRAMVTPERLNVRMTSPEQIEYGMDDMLVMRNDSRIFVVNTREYGGYLAHQYVIDSGATILDMAVSRMSPVIVFAVNIEDQVHIVSWNYDIGELTSINSMMKYYDWKPLSIALSEKFEMIAIQIDEDLSVWDWNLSQKLFNNPYSRAIFIAFDDDQERLIVSTREAVFIYTTTDWSSDDYIIPYPDIRSRSNAFSFDVDSNQLLVVGSNDILYIWKINAEVTFMGKYQFEDTLQQVYIALSPDGQYLATGTVTDTIIWELDIVD